MPSGASSPRHLSAPGSSRSSSRSPGTCRGDEDHRGREHEARVTMVALGTARAARRRAFWASVRRMSLASWMRVSDDRGAQLLALLEGRDELGDLLGVVAPAQFVEGLAAADAHVHLAQGDAEFVGPRALVLVRDPVQGLAEAEARAITTTARTSRKSGRVRSMTSLRSRIAGQMPGVGREQAEGEGHQRRRASWPLVRKIRKRRGRRRRRTRRGGPRSGRGSGRRGCPPCRSGGVWRRRGGGPSAAGRAGRSACRGGRRPSRTAVVRVAPTSRASARSPGSLASARYMRMPRSMPPTARPVRAARSKASNRDPLLLTRRSCRGGG